MWRARLGFGSSLPRFGQKLWFCTRSLLTISLVLVVAACGGGGGGLPSGGLPSLTGRWVGMWQATPPAQGGGQFIADFAQTGSSVSGSVQLSGSPCFTSFSASGTVSGNSFVLALVSGGVQRASASGTVSGNTITGRFTTLYTGTPCDGSEGTFTATRGS